MQTDRRLLETIFTSAKKIKAFEYRKDILSALPRLFIRSVPDDQSRFIVQVTNTGDINAYNCCMDIYIQPLTLIASGSMIPMPNTQLNFIKSVKITIAANESIDLDLKKMIPDPLVRNTYFVFLYDPLLDPFPMHFATSYKWSEENLLINANNPAADQHIAGWQEYVADNSSFTNAQQKTGNNRTWIGVKHPGNQPPAQFPWLETTFFHPKATAKKYAQLRQQVFVANQPDSQLIRTEINKGNVSFRASCFLRTYQPQHDKGKIRLELYQGNTLLQAKESQFAEPDNWVFTTTGEIKSQPNVESMTVKLIANREAGDNNDAYFDNISLHLKHRQIARLQLP